MTSSHLDDFFSLPEKEVEAAEFIAEVGRIYQEAFLRRKDAHQLSMQEVANKLDVNRSSIHRCLSGHRNLTLETMAELAWALDAKPRFYLDLDGTGSESQTNYFVPTAAPRAETTHNVVRIRNEPSQGTVTSYNLHTEATVRSNAPKQQTSLLEVIK